MKACAYDNINMTKMMKPVFDRIEKLCGKKRKCWLPAFSLFPTMFSKAFHYMHDDIK